MYQTVLPELHFMMTPLSEDSEDNCRMEIMQNDHTNGKPRTQ